MEAVLPNVDQKIRANSKGGPALIFSFCFLNSDPSHFARH